MLLSRNHKSRCQRQIQILNETCIEYALPNNFENNISPAKKRGKMSYINFMYMM